MTENTDDKPKGWRSRNTKNFSSSEHYTYYVGQRVLWKHGSENGIPFGEYGTVLEIPDGIRAGLLVQLDEREDADTFSGGAGLIPVRILYKNIAAMFSRRAKAYRDALDGLDYLGIKRG